MRASDFRRALGIYSVSDVCKMFNVERPNWQAAQKYGYVPNPQIKRGSRFYYSQEEVEAIREKFFSGENNG